MTDKDETIQSIVNAFKERFQAQTYEFRGEVSLILAPDAHPGCLPGAAR